MSTREEVDEVTFGLEIRVWDGKNQQGLAAVDIVELSDNEGVFYVPEIQQYSGDGSHSYYTGNKRGYANREQALRCVGRCIDKAEKYIAEEVARSKEEGY